MKRVSSVILAICIFVAFSVTTYALNTNEKTMDEDRLRIAASYFFWQDLKASDSESKWNTESDFDTPVPLYGIDNKLTAYYIKVLDTNRKVNGYMVVNASPENPCILEFGYGEKSGNLIEQYRTCDEEKIYYLYGGTYFSEEGFKEAYSSDIVENIVSISPKPNYALSKKIDYLYNEYKSLKNTMGLSSDYGIIDYGDLPSGTVFTGDLTEIYSLSWARTSDTNEGNNCGPTSGTNALIFFGNLLGVNFVPDKATTNSALYSAMKTGNLGTSVSNYCSGLKAYVKDKSPSRTVTTSSSTGYSWNTLKSNVQNDKMAVAYIRPIGIGAAHYINYVGYRQYYSDYQVNYVRILDNWNDTSDKYILYDTSYSSRVVSTTTINIT